MNLYLLDSSLPGSQCLDGSPAGFYYQPSTSPTWSSIWVIYFQGGGHCSDELSCIERSETSLGSSNDWSTTMTGQDAYSTDNNINPWFYGANHIFIPYCSGDWHSGQQSTPSSQTFDLYFNGHLIIENILYSLISQTNTTLTPTLTLNNNTLSTASHVLVTGDSAGGIGVLLNIDYISDFIHITANNPLSMVKGAPIAGWFFAGNTSDQRTSLELSMMPPNDYKHYKMNIEDNNNIISGGFGHNSSVPDLWGSYLHPICSQNMSDINIDTWHCFSAHNLYPYIKTDLFLIQYEYDNDQITYEMAMPTDEITENTINYVKYFGISMKQSILNRMIKKNKNGMKNDGLFLASCYDHTKGLGIGNDGAETLIEYTYDSSDNNEDVTYRLNSSYAVGNWFWELNEINEVPRVTVDNCDFEWPCNPTCDGYDDSGILEKTTKSPGNSNDDEDQTDFVIQWVILIVVFVLIIGGIFGRAAYRRERWLIDCCRRGRRWRQKHAYPKSGHSGQGDVAGDATLLDDAGNQGPSAMSIISPDEE